MQLAVQVSPGIAQLLRPIRCDDEHLLRQFVRDLSLQSRQRRFLGGVVDLSPRLSRALSCVDGVRHVALVMEEPRAEGRRLIAEGRLARNDDSDSAEIALSVADAWQGRGIGSRLLGELLTIADRERMPEVYAQLQTDNFAAARLFSKFGFELSHHPDDPYLLRAVR